jgi:hypothetical protein
MKHFAPPNSPCVGDPYISALCPLPLKSYQVVPLPEYDLGDAASKIKFACTLLVFAPPEYSHIYKYSIYYFGEPNS